MSNILDFLPSNYGYVVLAAAGGNILNMYLASKVMAARKTHNVKYPMLYSPTNDKFNCVQRAHQNYLENYPFFITSLLVGGLQNPKVSAIAGFVFLIGRVLYAKGYSSSGADGRVPGAIIAALSQFVMLGNVICLGMVHSGLWSYCTSLIGK